MLKSTNEDIKMYLPGSSEKKSLKAELEKLEKVPLKGRREGNGFQF